ncbi:MAG: PBP1A family penicillin-binding protein [Thermodesulfobacteriota bacterium]|nr:PBP1A family penicillin-binding protein [Thermodesulfobacteriota bacterium]
MNPRKETTLSPFRRNITYALLLVGAALVTGVCGGLVFALMHDLPQIQGLEGFRPAAITRIYSADKKLLAELFVEKRQPVPLAVVPEDLKAGILATEDAKFYTHPGVDLKGIARAVIRNIKAGEYAEGASTITQQLAKTLFLTPRKSIMRKVKEAFLAFQIERRYTKDEILALYLNQVYFGSGAYGVEAAAQIFFGKPVHKLTLPECALIAGMPKSPSRYSPLVNPSLALKRRSVVLAQMARHGLISEEGLKASKNAPLHLAHKKEISIKAPYFVAAVTSLLEQELGQEALYRKGLTVYTTLDYSMQTAAEEAVTQGLEQLSARMQTAGLVQEDDPPQAALICLDAKRGGILAMVGGRSFEESRFNRATMARRQPGSAFKPLVYALALEKGFGQHEILWDAPVVFRGAKEGQDWMPQNFSEAFLGEVTLRRALALSQNIPAVRLLNKLGPTRAVEFAYKMGIRSPLDPNLSLVLGTSEVTLLELTAAYAVFPHGGVWTRPFGVLEVLEGERSVWRHKSQARPVLTPETAAVMTDMLEAVIQEGTGKAAKPMDRPLAGKTGSTNGYKDALFVGFSPTLVTGVWVGLDDHGTLGDKETGARAALPIWIDFMEQALENRPYASFHMPEGVVHVAMDAESGLLASKSCPQKVTALFKEGTEPKEYCRHGSERQWQGKGGDDWELGSRFTYPQ